MPQATRLALAALALVSALSLAAAALAQTREPRAYLPMLVTTGSAQNPLQSGRATYYDATGDGNCMFGPSPNDLMVAAISHVNYSDPVPAAWCGAYVEATGELGSVVVRIVDKCPDAGCLRGHLDMSPQAFAKIAPLEKGIVPITWRVVSPPIQGPIAYHFKEGSNQWWTAVQVRNHRNPLAKLEYRNAQGQWMAVPRVDYNFFVAERGMGPGPYSFRVTDIYGNVLSDSAIAHVEGGTVPGAAQFPPGP